MDGAEDAATAAPARWYATADIPGIHPHIELSVERDGTELLRTRRSLSYSDVYANGPDCGVTCSSAAAELMLPASAE